MDKNEKSKKIPLYFLYLLRYTIHAVFWISPVKPAVQEWKILFFGYFLRF